MILNSVLTSEYSIFWLFVIVLFSLGISYILYRNDKNIKEVNPLVVYLLMALRFSSIFFISFFLIKPLITHSEKKTFKPKLLILQDNSESIALGKDSLYYRNDFFKKHDAFCESLQENGIDYSVYSFSDSIALNSEFKFDKKITNISNALKLASELNIKKNIGGILLLTDGIYNKGRDPFYLSKNFHLPIYTVGLGDTSSVSDLKIQEIRINKIGFTNQNIPFSIDVKSENIRGKNINLRILEKGKILFEKAININQLQFYLSVESFISHLKEGLHALDFELTVLESEYNVRNNKQTVYLNIVDTKKKILILYSAPHPDVAALRSVFSKQQGVASDFYNIQDFKGDIKNYNLVIFHQLPDKKNSIEKLHKLLSENRIPILNIITSKTDLKQLNKWNSAVLFTHSLNKNEWIELNTNKEFSLFNIDESLKDFINQVPPILTPTLNFRIEGEVNILAFQEVKGISIGKPAIIFSDGEDGKIAFVTGEGLWKWKLFNYQRDGNTNAFTELILKISQYLSLKVTKESFVVDIKNQYNEYEPIRFSVQLYNNSLEKIENQEVKFVYKEKDGKEYKYVLNPINSSYVGNIGFLKSGEYSYRISTKLKSKEISKSGKFIVLPSVLEYRQLTANHDLLMKISQQTHALFFDKNNWSQLVDSIKLNPNFKPQVYTSEKLTDLINLKWILLVLFVFLSTEWFIRKYFGII